MDHPGLVHIMQSINQNVRKHDIIEMVVSVLRASVLVWVSVKSVEPASHIRANFMDA